MGASEIIEKVGGQAAVAAITDSEPNTVVYWVRRGRIPTKHFPAILRLAQEVCAHDVTHEALLAQWVSPAPKQGVAQAVS